MIDRLPRKRPEDSSHEPSKAVRRNLGDDCNHALVIAALPAASGVAHGRCREVGILEMSVDAT
jgi:hypothetical protein